MSRLQPTPQERRYLVRLGSSIAAQRSILGLTQAELAARAGLHRSLICRAEAGGSVEMVSVVRIARGLGVAVGDLVGVGA